MQVLIEQLREERGWSQRELARRAKIGREIVRLRAQSPEEYTLRQIAQCCAALGITSLCQVVILDPPAQHREVPPCP